MSVVASHRRQMAPPQSSSEGEGGGDAPPAPAPSSSPSTNSTSPTSQTPPTPPTTLPPTPPSNGVILRQRPAIPPKPPQLDIVRFSMAQAKDEIDLDTILSELLELETQLSGEAGDRVLLGPSLASSKFQPPSSGPIHKHQNAMFCAAPIEQLAKRVQFQSFDKPHSSSSSSSSSNSATIRLLHTDATDFCASPDADSAFGDSSSTESAHQPHIPSSRAVQGGQTVRNLELFSVESFRGSLNTIPSPIQQISPAASNGGGAVPRPPSSAASYTSALDERKALKIREALEKMKEAKIKKVFVFIFLEDGTKRGLLVDERWTVAESMRQLADKLNVPLTPEHAIVEEYPHLHFKRIYEDHEHVVENLENWISESPNKLHFVRLPQKWALFRHPQHFLLTNRNRSNDFPSALSGGEWDGEQKQRLLDAFLREDGGTRVPELEGWLMLKADGKKSWRRHFFVLRSSGLYYVPKAGKPRGPARDLHCLMSVFNNQVYTCTDWRRKYKAPTDFGFAIKHPRIQMKTSKYIKYICCDDQFTFRQWLTALRITKNGCPALHKDFCAAQFRWRPLADAASSPVRVEVPRVEVPRVEVPRVEVPRVEVPRVPLQRLATLDSNFIAAVSSSSPRHRQPLQFGGASPSTTARTPSTPGGSSEGPSSRMDSPAPSMTINVFDQDECNTIKRHPDGVGRIGLRNHYQRSPISGSLGNTPTASTAALLETLAATNIGCNAAMESDSDEEQFPPPPPIDVSALIESPRHVAMLPSLPHSPNTSPWKSSVPPPPPKRSERTRLQMAEANSFEKRNAQGELMIELQQRQRMRTKLATDH